jgi:hypothetical protein
VIGLDAIEGHCRRSGCVDPDCFYRQRRIAARALHYPRRTGDRTPMELPTGEHGTTYAYTQHGCRCDACTQAHSRFNYVQRHNRARQNQDAPHGTLSGYDHWMCRCDACKAAHRDYQRLRRTRLEKGCY